MLALNRILVGDDRSVSSRFIAVAVALTVVVLLAFAVGFTWQSLPIPSMSAAVIGALIITFVAAIQSFKNNGLLVSIALGVGPVTGLFFHIVSEGVIQESSLGSIAILSLAWGLLFGTPIGIVGYGVGRLAHYLKNK